MVSQPALTKGGNQKRGLSVRQRPSHSSAGNFPMLLRLPPCRLHVGYFVSRRASTAPPVMPALSPSLEATISEPQARSPRGRWEVQRGRIIVVGFGVDSPSENPEGIPSFSLGLRVRELPWVTFGAIHNSEGVASHLHALALINAFDSTPSELMEFSGGKPSVARSSQRWAE